MNRADAAPQARARSRHRPCHINNMGHRHRSPCPGALDMDKV